MNYRHAFHAGNHADVLKHLTLMMCLSLMHRKTTPLAVLDTHAGIGMYDLESAEATRSPEWQGGIGRLQSWTDSPPLLAYLGMIKQITGGNPTVYPGSPVISAWALKATDLMMACELHAEDAGSLRKLFGRHSAYNPHGATIQIHQRDGWEALRALLPPPRPRGLVLIDPPYEAPGELERAAQEIGAALKRFAHGVYLWWRPLKSESALAAADAEVIARGARETLRADLWINTPTPTGKLLGSSVFLINPPFGLEAVLREALPALAERLAAGKAGYRLWPK